MAFPLPAGLTPPEIAFLCEMEMVTIVPRQRLEKLELLGGPTQPLVPPHRTPLPLWLALLLKRQRRANIIPPPWLHPDSLTPILELETKKDDFEDSFTLPPTLPSTTSSRSAIGVSPPFVGSCTADADASALPYHWLEVSELLLASAPDDLDDPDLTRRLLRDLREARIAKMRKGIGALDGEKAVEMTGVGAMEIGEGRGFITGVVEGLRKIGASKEQTRLEREAEEREAGGYGAGTQDDDDDDDMEFDQYSTQA